MSEELENQSLQKSESEKMSNFIISCLLDLLKIVVISFVSMSIAWLSFYIVNRNDSMWGFLYIIYILPSLLILFSIIDIILGIKIIKKINKILTSIIIISINVMLTVIYWAII
jgi:hypothetical protein